MSISTQSLVATRRSVRVNVVEAATQSALPALFGAGLTVVAIATSLLAFANL